MAVGALLVASISLFFSITGGWPSLEGYITPSISVEPITIIKSKSIVNESFELTNTGEINLYNVGASIRVNELKTAGGVAENDEGEVFPANRTLIPGEKVKVEILNSFSLGNVPTSYADITVRVWFKNFFNPSAERDYKFIGRIGEDGALHWAHDGIENIKN